MKNQVQLISYVDRFADGGISAMSTLLDKEFKGLFGGLHLLPFFTPIDGEDAGFDPIDHTQIDPQLGTWSDIAQLSQNYEVMSDMIVNHVSSKSPMFQDYLEKGEQSEFANVFLRMQSVFPDGASEADLLNLYRPRPGLPFSVYTFKNGERGLFWTTFTQSQLDINVNHPQGWQYLMAILNTFSDNGIKTIRLDATGYAVKKAGTSCFMLPETFTFIDTLKKEANSRNIDVLVEIHAHHQTQITISKCADYVYDFALPPLVLHTLINKNCAALKRWYEISPRNAVTVLDTHDGIGIIDAGASKPGAEDGLLNAAEIDALVNAIHKNSGGASLKATGAAASNVDLYQVNCTFFEALGKDSNAYLLARLIQFFSPGIPQVYYVGLLAGLNDMALLERSGVGRDINREYFTAESIAKALARPEVQHLLGLIKFRNSHPAFNGTFIVHDSNSDTMKVAFTDDDAQLELSIDFTSMTFDIQSTVAGVSKQFSKWAHFL